jgi:arsenate reductase-like glutaredoxin family protein
VDTSEHYRYFFRSRPVTNYDRNILDQQINQQGTHVAEAIHAKGKDMLLLSQLPDLTKTQIKEPLNTWYKYAPRPIIMDPQSFTELKPSDTLFLAKG